MKVKKSQLRTCAQELENYPPSCQQITTLSRQTNKDPHQFHKIIRMNSENHPIFPNEVAILHEKNSYIVSGKLKSQIEPKVTLSKKQRKQTAQYKFDQDLFSAYVNASEFQKKKPRFSRSSVTFRNNASKLISSETHNKNQQMGEKQKLSEGRKINQLSEEIESLRKELQTKTKMIEELSSRLQKFENKIGVMEEEKMKKQNKIIDLQFHLRVQRERSMQIYHNFDTAEGMLTKYKEESFALTNNFNKVVAERNKLKKKVETMSKMLAEQEKKRNAGSNRSLSVRNKTSAGLGPSFLQKTEKVSRFSMKSAESSFEGQQDLELRRYSPLNKKPISRIEAGLLELSPD